MIFVGDFIPQRLRPVCRDLPKDEIILANLEGPICADNLVKSVKVGVHLHSSRFELQGKWAFSLANNHLMDFGEEGLRQTLGFLKQKTFSYGGAGTDLKEARQPMMLAEAGKRIAVFSCCERQFGLATDSSAGVAEMGAWLFDAIRSVKSSGSVDYVVVSCHAASEFSPFVSPRLRAFYHRLVDAGADIIHGHHSHVPQGWERYGDGVIFYGLGNFVVDARQWNGPNSRWSNVARVDLENGVNVDFVRPYRVFQEDGNAICASVPRLESAELKDYMEAANQQFESDAFCESVWQEASVRLYHRIYEQSLRAGSVESVKLTGRDRLRKLYFAAGDVFRALIGRERPNGRSRFYARVLYNYFNCESHVDMIRTALGVLTGSCPDVRVDRARMLVDELLQHNETISLSV